MFAISEDPEGNLWVGTFGRGLERIDRSTGERRRYLHDPGDPSSLADDRVTALLNDRQGVLWAGTVGGGLSRFDPATGRFTSQRHAAAGDTDRLEHDVRRIGARRRSPAVLKKRAIGPR